LDQLPWWVDRLVNAGFAFVGATIGFAGGWYKDAIAARRAKTAFKIAIRYELEGLKSQLDEALFIVQDGRQRFERDPRSPPQFAVSLRNTVFSTQLGKLQDLNDPLILEITRFYSDLGMLSSGIEGFVQRRIFWTLN
jgi:hypothetical protein